MVNVMSEIILDILCIISSYVLVVKVRIVRDFELE